MLLASSRSNFSRGCSDRRYDTSWRWRSVQPRGPIVLSKRGWTGVRTMIGRVCHWFIAATVCSKRCSADGASRVSPRVDPAVLGKRDRDRACERHAAAHGDVVEVEATVSVRGVLGHAVRVDRACPRRHRMRRPEDGRVDALPAVERRAPGLERPDAPQAPAQAPPIASGSAPAMEYRVGPGSSGRARIASMSRNHTTRCVAPAARSCRRFANAHASSGVADETAALKPTSPVRRWR